MPDQVLLLGIVQAKMRNRSVLEKALLCNYAKPAALGRYDDLCVYCEIFLVHVSGLR